MKGNLTEFYQNSIGENIKEIINALPVAIFITDTEGKIHYYNSTSAQIFGDELELDAEQWYKSLKFYDIDGNSISFMESLIEETLKGRRDINGQEMWIERADGERSYFKAYSYPLYDEDEKVTSSINILIDVSDQEGKIDELKSAIDESEQKRRLYEAIASSTPDLVYVFDLNYRFTFANDALLEMWGKTRKESLGKRLQEVGYEPWHAEMHEREIDRVVETKEPVQGEVSFPHAKLGERFYEYILVPIINDEGEVEAVGGTTRDITERKQAEQALRENEEKYRTLVENFPNGAVGLFDKDLRYTAVGGELVSAVGLDPKERIGNKITDIYPEDIVEKLEPYFRAALEGEAKSFEGELRDRKLFAQTLPIKDEKGAVTSGMLVVQDITERRKAQQAMRRSEEKYRTLFETMEEGFCILNLEFDENNEVVDFQYEEVNSSFEKHTGLGKAEGKKGSEVLKNPKKDWVKIYAKVALTGEQEHFEYYSERLGKWFAISAFPVGDPKEQKVASLFNNITEQKQAQQELKKMNATLEEQVEERTKSLMSYQEQLRLLVAELSKAEERERQRLASDLHDNLGQMLALGKMKVAQLKAESLPESAAENLSELAEFIEDALTYTRDLTSYLKPPSYLDEEDLKAFINWVADKMKKHNLKVNIEDDEQAKPLDKEVRFTILQCVRELLFNVIKHASVNKAIVRLIRHDDQLQITVEDEGKGFDPDYSELNAGERGFGLFSIRERISLLGGRINIDSSPGQGTSVNLYVPLKDSKPIKDSFPKNSQGNEKSENIKILLADNHRMVREGLYSIIEKEDDMTVIGEVDNGEEAVEMSEKHCPDVVLVDVNLPKMNILDLVQAILEKDSRIRIIGLSGQDDEEIAREIRNAGANAFLSKKEAYQSLASLIRAETPAVE